MSPMLMPICLFTWISLNVGVNELHKWLWIKELRIIDYRTEYGFVARLKSFKLLIVATFFILYVVTLNPSVANSAELSPQVHRLVTGYAAKSNVLCANGERLAEAIRRAEGIHSKHPYGILRTFKHTTPKQACLNTIRHRYRLWLGLDQATRQAQPFIEYLASSYAPLGAKNDPSNLNINWIRNVRYFYER